MAMIFADGFDCYNNATDMISSRVWTTAGSLAGNYSTNLGRYGGGCFNRTSTSSSSLVATWPALNRVSVSFAIYLTGVNTDYWFQLTPASGSSPVRFFTSSGSPGLVSVRNGSTEFATFNMPVNQWCRIEIEAFRNATTGTLKIWVDEVLVVNFTGNTGNQDYVGMEIARYMAGRLDDIAVWSHTGDAPNSAPLGDFRIHTLRPIANGNQNDGTPVGAASNWECVSDPQGGDDDATYVENQNVGNIDLFQLADLSGTPSAILGAQVYIKARSEASVSRKIQARVRSGSTEVSNGTDLSVPNAGTYSGHSAFFPVDPDTGASWTPAGINAMEAGWEVTA